MTELREFARDFCRLLSREVLSDIEEPDVIFDPKTYRIALACDEGIIVDIIFENNVLDTHVHWAYTEDPGMNYTFCVTDAETVALYEKVWFRAYNRYALDLKRSWKSPVDDTFH